MNYNDMLHEAIETALPTRAIEQGYAEAVFESIKEVMSENMVVFYQP